MPETPSTDKHVGPAAGVACLHRLKTDGRVLARNQTHTFKLLQQVPTLENSLSPDIHAPLPLGSSNVRCRARSSGLQVQNRLWLVEVPPESSPEHHCNLPCRRIHRLVVAGRGIDNGGDIKTVAIQGRGGETRDVVAVTAAGRREDFRASPPSFFSSRVRRSFFTVYYDRPAGWKGRA